MFRPITAVLTIAALIGSSNLAWAAPAAREQKPSDVAALKEKLVTIPAGSTVEVKLLNKQKLKGKLGQLSDQGFEVQTVKNGTVTAEKVAFSEVKSIAQKGKPMGTGTKVALWTLAGFGIFVLVFTVICVASGGCDS